MEILAISGSLRSASINTAFCRAVARSASATMRVSVFSGMGDLPLFNPDLESAPPPSVQRLRNEVGRAQALILASPEYAHGISGVMKNALDWLVSYEGFGNKPVAIVNASPRATHAFASLEEILKTMSANIVREATVSIPLHGACTTEEAMLASPEVSRAIQTVLSSLVEAPKASSIDSDEHDRSAI